MMATRTVSNFSPYLPIILSIHQTNLVEWVAKVYYSSLGEMQRQSLRKGIYNALTKHYVRVLGVDEDLGKRQKRGTIRWRKQKSY